MATENRPDPLGLSLLLGGTALDIMGTYRQAQASHDNLLYQADQLRQDAMLVEIRAKINERAHRKQTDQVIAEMTRNFARGGVVASTGSPLRAMQTYAKESAIDLYWMGKEAAIQSQRLREGAAQKTSQAADVLTAAHATAAAKSISAFAQMAQYLPRGRKREKREMIPRSSFARGRPLHRPTNPMRFGTTFGFRPGA